MNFTQKILYPTFPLVMLGVFSYTAAYAATPLKDNPVTHTVRYLDSSVWNIVVNENDCFLASPRSLLQVEPITSGEGQRVYKVSQFFDLKLEKELYSQPLEQQIKNHKIIGREFCGGVVSISNLDIPFSKGEMLEDENDGMLLIDKVNHELAKIKNTFNQMNSLAAEAANGVYSSSQLSMMQNSLETLIQSLDRTSQAAIFNHIPLLNGTISSIDIPINKHSVLINIPLINTTSKALNVSNIDISTTSGAQGALDVLAYKVFDTIDIERMYLEDAQKRVSEEIKENADITMIDVSNDDFVVQYQKASLVVKPNKTSL